MSETRKIAAILVSDVVGYSRLAGADEDSILLMELEHEVRLIPPAHVKPYVSFGVGVPTPIGIPYR